MKKLNKRTKNVKGNLKATKTSCNKVESEKNLTSTSTSSKGITLIALVITIIVLLILAGITVAAITGENGILTKATKAKELTNVASEREAIEIAVTLSQMEKNLDSSNKYYMGVPLYDKTLANGNLWNVIVDEEQQVYGTGWNYIQLGTFVEGYGNTKNEWLVNYNSGEIIQLENGKYSNISYASSLAVTDGLVFNADPTNMADSSSWGDGVTLQGFDDNEGDIWSGNSLNFDGINDYITINGNLDVEDEITLECYGKINGYYETTYNFVPLFSAYNGKGTNVDGQCMRIWENKVVICANFGYVSCENSNIWENENAKHNLAVVNSLNLNTDFMYTMTYNHSTCMYTVYRDGALIRQEKLDKSYWDNFKNNEIPYIEYFQIGKVRWNDITGYLNGSVYSMRIYNKCLTQEQVKENYDKTVAYHNLDNK